MAMPNDPQDTNTQEVNTMRKDLLSVLPRYDRAALQTILPDNTLVVEAFEDYDTDEVGAFAWMAIESDRGLTRAIHISLHKDVIAAETYPINDPNARPTRLFLFNDELAKDGLISTTNFEMVDNKDFILTTIDEDGVVKKTKELNTNDFELAMWWPSKETGVDVVLVPKGEVNAWNTLVVAGTSTKPYTLERAKYFIEQLFEIPLGFGSAEQLYRYMTSALNMHGAEILFRSNLYRAIVQIKSEEMIDIAVQADKMFKRLTTLFRVGTPVNEIVRGEAWMFYMIKAQKNEGEQNYVLDSCFDEINALRKDWESEITPEGINHMKVMWHDGCIFVSPDHLDKMVPMIEDRYNRLDYSKSKLEGSLKKFQEGSITWQLRATGGLLIDQFGEAIGMKGHLKTHIMVAAGPVARWMKKNNIAFFGTSEAYKEDMAVMVEDAMALVVQTKAPKFENTLSAQFLNSIDGALQLEDIIPPLVDLFKEQVAEVIDMSEEKLAAYAKSLTSGIEDMDDDEELGAISRGFNELLATYSASGLDVTDSAAAVYSIKTMILQKFGFATLSNVKNEDMSNKGFGRNIRLPIPAVRLQVFPRAFMIAGGYSIPEIPYGQSFYYVSGGTIRVKVVNDLEWIEYYDNTGGPDLDDFWEDMLYVRKSDGKLRIKTQRNPAVYGEYILSDIHEANKSVLLDTVDNGHIPVIDESLLPQRVDQVIVNGNHVPLMTLAEFHDVIAKEKGEPMFAQLNSDDERIMVQKKAMRTYIQMITIAGFNELVKAHNRGQWKRMDSRLLLPIPSALADYHRIMDSWPDDQYPKPRRPRGTIQGIINGVVQKISDDPTDERYIDFHAMVRQGVNPFFVPREYYGDYVGQVMEEMIRTQIASDQDQFDGAITLVRNQMEEILVAALDQINRRTYHEYGIKLRKAPSGVVIYNDRDSTPEKPTSQTRLTVLARKVEMSTFFGEAQTWKLMRANSDWLDLGNRRKVVKVLGLEDTQLGRVVHNTDISKFVPAASFVRAAYSNRFRELKERGDDRPTTIMNSRRAWLDALEQVRVEVEDMEDVYKFVLALLYVLKATPHVTMGERNSVNTHLRGVFNWPVNVEAERLLYTSILMNWGEEHYNLVLGAFKYLQSINAATANRDVVEFEQVLHYFGGRQTIVFLPKVEGAYVYHCSNCGKETVFEKLPMKTVEFIERAGGVCKECRDQAKS